jgi:hypothetical protein
MVAISGAGVTRVQKDYTFTAGASGVRYVAGFYRAPAADANLTQAATTVTLGGATEANSSHAFAVLGGAGAAASGTVELRVTGTSITDAGVRTPADSETLIADITAGALDQYLESTKKWLGTTTWELNITSGAPATYSLDFNYGFAKYEDFGNKDSILDSIECVGVASANESGLNIELLHHNTTGWTYSAAAFVAGADVLFSLGADTTPEDELTNGDPFAWKHTGLDTPLLSATVEGVVIRITTATNNSIEDLDIHLEALVREM